MPSNPCSGPSPRTQISYFLLSTCTEELISTTKIIKFLLNSLLTEKVSFLSNPIPYTDYLYSSISTLFDKLTAPNKYFFKCWITTYIKLI